MKKFFLINFIIFLTSCGIVKEGFVNNKKNGSDEFLVEKKSPLSMPPDFENLPEPKSKKESNIQEEEDNNIESLIIDIQNNNNSDENKSLKNSSNLEDSIIELIKKN